MLKRSHYIALGFVVAAALILLNMPAQLTARLKLGIGSVFLPMFGLASSSRDLASSSVDALTPRRELARQNEALRRENQQLKILNARAESIEAENSRLRDLVGWKRQQRWNLRLARVIGREPSNWWRTVEIDVGTRHGARENLPVLTAQGLVGRIARADTLTSQVVLLGDPNCKVAARVGNPAGDTGIIGPGGPLQRDMVEMSYLPPSAIVQPGQKVRTSGQGGLFPRDLPIGMILDANPVEYGLYTVARVKLAADLSALDEVWVLFLDENPGNTTSANPAPVQRP